MASLQPVPKKRARGLEDVRPMPVRVRELPASPIVLRLRPDRRDDVSRQRIVERLRAEFTESPGLALTVGQAARLLALAPDVCTRVLESAREQGFLERASGGRYRRRSDS